MEYKEKGVKTLMIKDEMLIIRMLKNGSLIGIRSKEKNSVFSTVLTTSYDNGHTWSEEETLFEIQENSGQWILGEILVDKGQQIHLFFLNIPQSSEVDLNKGEGEVVLEGELLDKSIDIWYARSFDNMARWTKLKRIWKGYTGALNSVIETSSGRILLPFSYLTRRTWKGPRGKGLDNYTFTGCFDCVAIYSDDSGGSWHMSNSIRLPVPDLHTYGGVEPVVIEMKDKRIWMLIRSQMGRFYESFSNDGALWSNPVPSKIISSDSPAGIRRLGDGRIVLIWNKCLRYPYAYGGRHVIHGAISDDEGETWQGHREIVRDMRNNEPPPYGGDFGTAYPYPTVINDDKILFCTGQGKGRVVIGVLDPDWLTEKNHEADFENSQDEWIFFATREVGIVDLPGEKNRKGLSVRRISDKWPAVAVWNFPLALKGLLDLEIMLDNVDSDCFISLTDHFSVPFDPEEGFHNVFDFYLTKDLAGGVWKKMTMQWDCSKGECYIINDNRIIRKITGARKTEGICYLRIGQKRPADEKSTLYIRSARMRSVQGGF